MTGMGPVVERVKSSYSAFGKRSGPEQSSDPGTLCNRLDSMSSSHERKRNTRAAGHKATKRRSKERARINATPSAGQARHHSAAAALAPSGAAARSQAPGSRQTSSRGRQSGTGSDQIGPHTCQRSPERSTRDGSSEGLASEGTHSSQMRARKPRLWAWKA